MAAYGGIDPPLPLPRAAAHRPADATLIPSNIAGYLSAKQAFFRVFRGNTSSKDRSTTNSSKLATQYRLCFQGLLPCTSTQLGIQSLANGKSSRRPPVTSWRQLRNRSPQ